MAHEGRSHYAICLVWLQFSFFIEQFIYDSLGIIIHHVEERDQIDEIDITVVLEIVENNPEIVRDHFEIR